MYSVLIVEDLDIVREDLKNLINWQEHGFQLVGTAKNGEAGLEVFYRTHPDIVITDIRMPILDGLSMIREIRKTSSGTQFILLTAFEEFEYAKTALYLDVHSYVMKYELDDEVLLRELDKSRAAIEKTRRLDRMEKNEHMKQYLSNSQDESPHSFFSWYGRSVLLLSQTDARLRGHKHQALCDALRERLSSRTFDTEFEDLDMSPEEHFLFLKVSESLSERKSMEFIHWFVSQYTDILLEHRVQTALAVGPYLYSADGISSAYQSAKKLLRQKVFYKKGCVIYSAPAPVARELEEMVRRCLEDCRRSVREMDLKNLEQSIPQMFTELLPRTQSVELLEECVRELTHVIAVQYRRKEMETLNEVLDEIVDCSRNLNIFELTQLFLQALTALDTAQGGRYSKRVHTIIQYIDTHYQEDVSLCDLSLQLDLSMIYISQLFKKEVGTTFSSYLTKTRVEKAIELLSSGKYKVYEVSEMVGYQTVQYFSKLFKKETGKKPSAFCPK